MTRQPGEPITAVIATDYFHGWHSGDMLIARPVTVPGRGERFALTTAQVTITLDLAAARALADDLAAWIGGRE